MPMSSAYLSFPNGILVARDKRKKRSLIQSLLYGARS